MKQVCSSCHYIGEIIKPRYRTYKFPISAFLLGIGANYLIGILTNAPPFDSKSNNVIIIGIIFFLLSSVSGGYLLFDDLRSKNPHKSSPTFLILSIILAVLGFMTFSGAVISSAFDQVIPTSIWFIFGLVSVIYYYRDSITCPNCEKREMLIPINEDRAQKIIKENNLTIPDDPVEPAEERV